MSNYKHPKNLHQLALRLSHGQMNEKLGELGYVKQQKGGFWIEHRSFAKNEYGISKHKRTPTKSPFIGRWERNNRLAVKTDYLKRVKAKKINTAVCLPSVSPTLVAKTFKDFGFTNLHGFEIKTKEYNACVKALKKSNNPHAILMHKGDVLNHINLFKTNCFVEADFCGTISTYKKFFLNLPQYWSLTVCSTRYGSVDKILEKFSEYMGGKVVKGQTIVNRNDMGETIYEYTKLQIKKDVFHLYKYRDPKPDDKRCSTMVVITNI